MNTLRPPCTCGNLAQYAADPGTPFSYDAGTDSYSLDLGIATVPNVVCPFCGGFNDGPRTSSPPLCACGSPEAWADDPHVPVEWGTIGKYMFGLRCRGETIATIAIWFCPACGGRARDVMALGGGT